MKTKYFFFFILLVILIISGCTNKKIKECFLTNIQNQCSFSLSGNISLLDINANQLFINDLTLKNTTLALRIPPNAPIATWQTEIDFIKSQAIDESEVLLIFSEKNLTDLKLKYNKNNYNFFAVNLYDYEYVFPENLENYKQPYYFTISQNHTCNNVFFPHSKLFNYREIYIDHIKRTSLFQNHIKQSEFERLFQSRRIDIGEINYKDSKQIRLTFENTIDKTITIESIKSNCGCIVTSLSKRTIMPKETFSIIVTYTALDFAQFYKHFYLNIKDKDSPVRFTICGVVIE
ncbi:DUF1573 domain-containing protein [Marinilabilia rubra]|nr:DUF1573 domain-containing protein [Marinilabilia rubra]